MASLIPEYNYDIFISYRQKDNKYDGWVTEFVEHLKAELESTFKEEISVYFDINPHDGLLETHDVDESLKDKLKCLIFIPILSRTYCDPKSFAWEHEFNAFVELASKYQFGLKVKLPNGNVAGRVLPVRIHELDPEDAKQCESVLGGFLRGIDFIYKEPGVNKPLTADDDEKKNLNGTRYRIQINKTANAIKEIISGLKKEPAESKGEAREMSSAVGNPVVQEKSILVLPFENISPDPDQEYFSDGLTEEIITDLSHIHDLLVISRSSAMTFKGTKRTVPEIARAVNVRYVLEGSVRKSGNNIRITAQLIDGISDSHLWAEKYTGTLDDIFEIQEKVSSSIVSAVKVKFRPDEIRYISQRQISNLEAYEYYLKARQEIYRFTEEGFDRAVKYLEKGLEITGDNLLLYSCIGNVYFQYWNLEMSQDESYLKKAKSYAELIFKIEPDSHYGRVIIGLLNSFDNPRKAIWEFKKVLQIDPCNDDALLWLCFLSAFLGKTDQINHLIAHLIKTDPFNSIVKIIPGLKSYYQGELDRAYESVKEACQSDRNDFVALWHFGRIQAACGLMEDALSTFDTVAKKCELCPGILSGLFAFALRGQKQEILQFLNPDIRKLMLSDFLGSLFTAECFTIAGDPGNALEWLENTVNLGFVNYPYLNEYSVFLKNIRGEERFKKLMERVKHEWENFEV